MGLEIEKKFLVANSNWTKKIITKTELRQGYLSLDPERLIRIRVKKKKGILTVKSVISNLTNLEYEYDIPLKDAEELLGLCKENIIKKTRFEVDEKGATWEIDVFKGDNNGLIVAEIELKSENQKIQFPDWIGKEVTNESKYSNFNLVKKPFSMWNL